MLKYVYLSDSLTCIASLQNKLAVEVTCLSWTDLVSKQDKW